MRKKDRGKPGWGSKIALGAAAVCLLSVPAVFLNTIYGYLPLLMLALLGGASALYSRMLCGGLAVGQSAGQGSCQRGETLPFSLEVDNRSRLVCTRAEARFFLSDLFGNPASERIGVFTLAPREKQKMVFDISFDHLGAYEAGLKELRVCGLFGLFMKALPRPAVYQVNVTPNLYPIERLRCTDTVQAESERSLIRSSAESMDYFGVREYAPGDPIKTIHWKLSAHSSCYLTKQMESYGSNGLSVILDFAAPLYESQTRMDVFDCLVETGVSLCHYARGNGLDDELLFVSRHGERRRYVPSDFSDLSQLMGELPFLSDRPGNIGAEQMLWDEVRSLYSQANLALCTASITQGLLQQLINARSRRKNPMLFFVLPDTVYDAERLERLAPLSVLEGAGIPYRVLSHARELGKEGG